MAQLSRWPAIVTIAAVLCAQGAQGRVTKIVVETTAPAVGDSGSIAYEIVTGRFYGEVDPNSPENAIITDLEHAPRNSGGQVEYSATFAMARPINASDSSGVLFYDVPNRGNGSVAADPDGNVRVISGWQGDLPDGVGLQTIKVPTATDTGQRPLTGLVFARFVDMPQLTSTLPITASIGRPTAMPEPVTLNTKKAKLYVQSESGGKLRLLSSKGWAFANCNDTTFPGVPDPTKLCIKAGFDPKLAYTLVYTAKNPKVMGLGFAATRDLVSFFRNERADDTGAPSPAGKIKWAVASGTSQSGNFIKSFVHLGFNADEKGRTVFDGINPNIAARQIPLNLRFSVPGGAARPFEPGSEGTLWWSSYDDTARRLGRSSLLDRCKLNSTCPKVIETFGSAEFWGLRMAPGLIGTDGQTDIPLPDNVRRYYFPSVTHGGSWTGGFPLNGDAVPAGCLLAGNPNPMLPELRMAQRFLIRWVKAGVVPPPSVYPTLKQGDLVAPKTSAMGWPNIPGAPVPDGKLNPLPHQRFGPSMRVNDMSGVLATLPPDIGGEIPQLVPRVDADGNEISGIRSVQLMVPLGSYLGWNVQAAGFSKGEGCGFAGGYIPFARTKRQREAQGDPRLSLEERYQNQAGFEAKVKAAIDRHLNEGWLSSADADLIMKQAKQADIFTQRD